mgnify:FL=1
MRNLFIALYLITQYGSAQNSIYARAFNFFNVENAPGGVIAIGQGDSIIFKKAYGLANLETGAKIDFETIFNVGSVTKQFTCFAMMLLEQEGKINWEDDVRKYIPELPFYGDTIRLKHCAQHTSGLRDCYGLLMFSGLEHDSLLTAEKALNVILNQPSSSFPPGKHYDYNNSGFVLMAEVIKRVSGLDFPDFMKERVFKPLEMQSAFVKNSAKVESKNSATSYRNLEENAKPSQIFESIYGACNIYMNLEDAIKWFQYQNNPSQQHNVIFAKMATQARLNNGNYLDYGYGVDLTPYKGLSVIHHFGQANGFRTIFARFPGSETYFIGMNNANTIDKMEDAMYLITDSIFQLEAKQEWKFDTADYSIKEIDSTELKKFVGDFKLPRNKVVSTFIYKNRLYAFAPWGEDYPLYYLGNNEFACEIGTVTFKFKEGKLKKMVIPHSIFKINGRLLNPSETKGVKSNELLGAYYCKDADATFEIKIEDCKLVLHHKEYGSIPLTQFKTLSFHLNNLWINKLWFTKEKGHITSFKTPLSEYEKLTFLKQ